MKAISSMKNSRKKFAKASSQLIIIFMLLSIIGLAVVGCAEDPVTNTPPEPEEAPEAAEEVADNDVEPEADPEPEAELAEEIVLATTTSTYDSGLLDELLPVFEEQTGIEVQVLSMGTGAAIETGQRGDVDILLVHDRFSELELVEEGCFTDREDVMYNDFILLGPPEDQAGIKGMESVLEAFEKIAESEAGFASRGDDSGTHRMELSLWEEAGVETSGDWHYSTGQGMGETLGIADDMLIYSLTDRGTYLSMRDNLDLDIVLEGDPLLFNQYGIMAVNPELHEHVKYESALKLIEFFMSSQGQDLTAGYRIDGESLFFPGYGLE